jgi:ribosomal protein S12 methylthiotransferase accessory factor
VPRIEVPPQLAPAVSAAAEAGVAVRLLLISTDVRVPVVAAVVDDPAQSLLAIGFACRNTIAAAATKAWIEAIGLYESMRDLQRPDGLVWGGRRSRLRDMGLKPLRADRAYGRSYRADFKDVTSLFQQLQLAIDPAVYAAVRPLTLGVTAGREPAVDERADRDWRWYHDHLSDRGIDVVEVDLTSPDIARTGLMALRLLATGMLPNFAAAFPPAGSARLWTAPRAAGWLDPAQNLDDLNRFPLPYA